MRMEPFSFKDSGRAEKDTCVFVKFILIKALQEIDETSGRMQKPINTSQLQAFIERNQISR